MTRLRMNSYVIIVVNTQIQLHQCILQDKEIFPNHHLQNMWPAGLLLSSAAVMLGLVMVIEKLICIVTSHGLFPIEPSVTG
jgi:hypothetical protein